MVTTHEEDDMPDEELREEVTYVLPTPGAELPEDDSDPEADLVDETAAIIEDYGQYRAVQLLLVHGVPAFGPGQPVPASHPKVPAWLEQGLLEVVGQRPAGGDADD